MINQLLEVNIVSMISWFLMLSGAFFILSGAVGVLRFPDFYSRIHPSGLIDSAGAPLILVGIAIQYGMTLITLKILLLVVFLLFTGSTSTHALVKAAMLTGLRPYGKIDDSSLDK